MFSNSRSSSGTCREGRRRRGAFEIVEGVVEGEETGNEGERKGEREGGSDVRGGRGSRQGMGDASPTHRIEVSGKES